MRTHWFERNRKENLQINKKVLDKIKHVGEDIKVARHKRTTYSERDRRRKQDDFKKEVENLKKVLDKQKSMW